MVILQLRDSEEEGPVAWQGRPMRRGCYPKNGLNISMEVFLGREEEVFRFYCCFLGKKGLNQT